MRPLVDVFFVFLGRIPDESEPIESWKRIDNGLGWDLHDLNW